VSATKERPPLSWKARRRGEKRCAPACGRGCTQAEYERALERAQLICQALGKGWKQAIHENLGWHVAVRKGEVRVNASWYGKDAHYQAGTDDWGILGTGRTAQAALQVMVDRLRKERNDAERILKIVEEVIR
jgi:hypothetical protein